MRPQYPWTKNAARDKDKVGLFSFGSVEEKMPFVMYPYLLSSDVLLCAYKNYDYPEDLSVEITEGIKSLLRTENLKGVVFDVRVPDWTNIQNLRHARDLSLSLLKICSDLAITSSATLSNGCQLIGNAVGLFYEMMEARDVLKGEGPSDLTKFTLEIGADFLLMTKRARERIKAKKRLRDQIVNGTFIEASEEISSQISSWIVSSEKIRISTQKKGFVHYLAMNKIHSLKSKLAAAHPGNGFSLIKKPGDWIEIGDDIVEVLLPKGQKNPLEDKAFKKAFVITNDPSYHQPLILEKIDPCLR